RPDDEYDQPILFDAVVLRVTLKDLLALFPADVYSTESLCANSETSLHKATYANQRYLFYFFFQAEDGIRYSSVTGVQTCALPISSRPFLSWRDAASRRRACTETRRRSRPRHAQNRGCLRSGRWRVRATRRPRHHQTKRSEERRVGKERRTIERAAR